MTPSDQTYIDLLSLPASCNCIQVYVLNLGKGLQASRVPLCSAVASACIGPSRPKHHFDVVHVCVSVHVVVLVHLWGAIQADVTCMRAANILSCISSICIVDVT